MEPPIYTGINELYQLDNVRQLLASGAKVNAQDKNGRTALDFAEARLNFQPGRTANSSAKTDKAVVDLLTKHVPNQADR